MGLDDDAHDAGLGHHHRQFVRCDRHPRYGAQTQWSRLLRRPGRIDLERPQQHDRRDHQCRNSWHLRSWNCRLGNRQQPWQRGLLSGMQVDDRQGRHRRRDISERRRRGTNLGGRSRSTNSQHEFRLNVGFHHPSDRDQLRTREGNGDRRRGRQCELRLSNLPCRRSRRDRCCRRK